MGLPKDDEGFVRLWHSHGGSATRMAAEMGTGVRTIFGRRRRVERRLGIALATANALGKQEEYPEYMEMDLEDGEVFVFSDAHYWPGASSPAHEALLRLLKKRKPKLVVANGDIIDGATTSRFHRLGWEKRPKLWDEIKAAQDRMAEIERAAKGAKRVWCLGNHDNRLDGYLANNASEAEDLPGTCLRDYFGSWTFTQSLHLNPDSKGHTCIKHRYRGGKHAAANNTLNAGVHMVTGHDHMLNLYNWGDYAGRKFGVQSGQLSESYGDQFRYAEGNPRAWCSGFVVLTYREGRLLPPEFCYVIEGEAWFRGEAV